MRNLTSLFPGKATYILVLLGLLVVWGQWSGLLAIQFHGQPLDLGGSEPVVASFKLLLVAALRRGIGARK